MVHMPQDARSSNPSVDPQLLETLESNGVSRDVAIRALQATDNSLEKAIDLISSNKVPPSSTPAAPVNRGNVQPPVQASPHNALAIGADILQSALQGALSGSLSMDEEMKKAIELSMKDSNAGNSASKPISLVEEDDDFQKAIAASKMNAESSLVGVSKEEIEMNSVVLASLQEVKGDVLAQAAISTNPHFRKKEAGVSTGLKNVGNTCYFNSMLQTYFMIPEVRQAVLQFVPSSIPNAIAPAGTQSTEQTATPADTTVKDTVNFMQELQKLFALLLSSNQKFIDPSPLLKKFMGYDGKPVNIGEQEDVSDINNLFLRRLSQGFTAAIPSQYQNNALIKNLFFGTGENILVGNEADGSPFESKKEIEYSTLILPVNEQPSDLFDRIDASVCSDEVEYTTDKGHKTKVKSVTWFKRLPPILMLQENRAGFDQERKTNVKRDTPIQFEKQIYIDRYLIENREETTKRRAVVSAWKHQLHQLEKELNSYTHYKGQNFAINSALHSVIAYYTEKQQSEMSDGTTVLDMIIKDLNQSYEKETAIMNELQRQIDELKSKINSAYNDMTSRPYELFGVWIHQGFAGSGHYWSYIRNPQAEKWIKFNDIRVSEMDEDTVMKEAIGGVSNTSAYFLIYMDTAEIKNYFGHQLQADEKLISPELKKEVEEDNQKFLKELEEYDKKSLDKNETFFLKYQERIKEVESLKTHPLENDDRISSYFSFLDSLGLSELMLSEILKQTYEETFKSSIEKYIGYSSYEKVQSQLGRESVARATQIALDDSEVKPYRQQYATFQEVAQLHEAGLSLLNQRKYIDSAKFLISALTRDNQLSYAQIRRESELLQEIYVCLDNLLEDAIKRLNPDTFNVEFLFKCVIACTKTAFPSESQFFQLISNKFSSFVNSKFATSPPSAQLIFTQLLQVLNDPSLKVTLPFDLETPTKMEKQQQEQISKKLGEAVWKYRSTFGQLAELASKVSAPMSHHTDYDDMPPLV